MARIRVNPASLISSASSVVSIASQVSKIGDRLLHATHGTPSYSGQFGPRVVAIALSSLAHSKKNQSFLTNQSSLLKKKASAFQSADSTSIANLRKTSLFPLIDSSTYLRLLSIIMGISITQLLLLIRLGNLQFQKYILPWSIFPPKYIDSIRENSKKAVGKETSSNTQTTSTKTNTTESNEEQEKEKTNKTSISTPALNDVSPTDYKICAKYAEARRPDLGTTECNNEKYTHEAAANYICKFEDKAFQISSKEDNLTDVIGKGYAFVWEPTHPSANDTFGHIAIVEEVHDDYVIVSHAGWKENSEQYTKLTIDQISTLWIIP